MKEAKTYCAFLRGVNVNRRTMKMAEVCSVFQKAGMTEVSSILASGNIIFQSDMGSVELRGVLERAMSAHYSAEVNIFIKSGDEVEAILSAVPFMPHPESHIYAFIGEPGFEMVLMDAFQQVTPLPAEEAVINNGIFFWQVGKGSTLEAGFSKMLSRKSMRDKFTSRNMRTIAKICDKIKAAQR